MCWTIAGGTVAAAALLLPAAPAVADVGNRTDTGVRAESGVSPGATRRSAQTAEGTSGRGPRRLDTQTNDAPDRETRAGRGPSTTPTEGTEPDPRPRPCHRWPYWPPWPPFPDTRDGNWNTFFVGAEPPTPAAQPVTVLSEAPRSPVSFTPAAPAMPPAAASTAGPETGPVPTDGMSVRDAVSLSPAAVPPRAPSAIAQTARTPLPPPAALPPPSLLPRAEGIAEAIRQALPGLVGLAMLTAAGGLLGYRQAKAGFALRAAGTARFLR